MLYEAKFVKFRPDMSFSHATQLCNDLNVKNVKPLCFGVKQIVKCNLSDIENVFCFGVLPRHINGYSSISLNGIWQCIVLQTKSVLLIVYTAGHQTPMYVSVASDLMPTYSHTNTPLQ